MDGRPLTLLVLADLYNQLRVKLQGTPYSAIRDTNQYALLSVLLLVTLTMKAFVSNWLLPVHVAYDTKWSDLGHIHASSFWVLLL